MYVCTSAKMCVRAELFSEGDASPWLCDYETPVYSWKKTLAISILRICPEFEAVTIFFISPQHRGAFVHFLVFLWPPPIFPYPLCFWEGLQRCVDKFFLHNTLGYRELFYISGDLL